MKSLGLTQEYYICAVDKKGRLPAYNRNAAVCLVAGGIMEMQLAGCISIEDEKLSVLSELPDSLGYLRPLYEVVDKDKPMKLNRIVELYMISFTGKKRNSLAEVMTESVREAGAVTAVKGGLFRTKTRYIPKKEAVDAVIEKIRAGLTGSAEPSEEIVILTALLDKAWVLRNCLTKDEYKQVKDRLTEIKKSDAGRTIKELIDHIERIVAFMMISTASVARSSSER